MADLYLTPAERYTAALGGFYYGDLPEPGTVYTQLIKDILDGSTPDKEPKNILARFIYSLYISDLEDPYPRYELAKLLYWKLHDITPTKSGSILTVTIDGKEDYMTINTDLSRLWYKVLFGSKTDVVTEFPYIFNTMQNKLSDWELFGNTETSGTPSPDNPIMPQGTGERTGNLFDISSVTHQTLGTDGSLTYESAMNLSGFIKVDGNYTVSWSAVRSGAYMRVSTYDDNKNFIARIVAQNTYTRSSYSNTHTGYIRINYENSYQLSDVQVNTGSTALPYEPYGVKIPFSSANTTTPVYLGEVESTRKVKKIVFVGSEAEDWSGQAAGGGAIRFRYTISNSVQADTAHGTSICTHLPLGVEGSTWNTDDVYTISNNYLWLRLDSSFTTVAALKLWLAQQYANGTPFTVYYTLETEETAVVNEPLMKIGEYADSMSRAQTGIDIPTVIGQNTLDVLTTVKPSSMLIEYTSADENRSRSKRISLLKSPLKKGLIK